MTLNDYVYSQITEPLRVKTQIIKLDPTHIKLLKKKKNKFRKRVLWFLLSALLVAIFIAIVFVPISAVYKYFANTNENELGAQRENDQEDGLY